jgi:hypothetical protein
MTTNGYILIADCVIACYSIMSKRGNSTKPFTTVDIFQENYEVLKNKATQQRYDVKEYVNLQLQRLIEKEEFLGRYAPNISIDAVNENKITLRDSKYNGFIDITVHDKSLFCSFHRSCDCIHTRFVWASPEVAAIANDDFLDELMPSLMVS